ncbi:MAG: flagellar biosynthesis protein FlhF [Treponema sp.]|nr:flagellar biosynthesis protein FlhF [Treponema sp.]
MNNRLFSEQAPTLFEAEMKAKEKYGERLTILKQEAVKIPGGFLNLFSQEGVRITGFIPAIGMGQGQYRAGAGASDTPAPLKAPVSGEAANVPAANMPAANMPAARGAATTFAEEKEKILAMANAGKESAALKEVLTEIKSIKEKLESQGLAGSREEHPTLNRIDEILILNDFPAAYRKSLLDRGREEITLGGLDNYNAVQDKFLEWIGESVKIYGNDTFKVRPRIMILVGPTGVGKTTTIAKLAANFGIDDKANQKRRIVLITIDTYRIGAREHLEKYGELLEFPCYSVSEYDEMKKILALHADAVDLFLIDTIGRNPRDMVQLGEMKQLLSACGTLAETHLAVAATTKASDLKEILQQFEAFDYRSVLVTKMDETIRMGNVIGALAEKGKSVSYMTFGQKVPTDIRKASVIQFLINLEGFRVNRVKMEEKFPDKGHEQMQKWR